MAKTLLSYITDSQRLLHDASYRFWPKAELTDYANKARRKVNEDCWCNMVLQSKTIAAATTLAGATYAYGSIIPGKDVVGVLDVLFQYTQQTSYPLKYLPFSSAVRTSMWQYGRPATPEYYTIHNRNVIVLPWPQSDYPNSMFNCLQDTTDMSADTDAETEIMNTTAQEAVGFYMAHLAKLKDQRMEEAEEFFQLYARKALNAIDTSILRKLVNR